MTYDLSPAQILARATPPLVMTIQDVALLCGYSYQHTQAAIVTRPDFPKPLDRFAQPRYARPDVLKWAGVEP